MASTPASIGPVLPSKAEVWTQARRIRHLAARAMEFAGKGPTSDLQLALKEMDAIRAVLGAGIEPADVGETAAVRGGTGCGARPLSRNPAAAPDLAVMEARGDG